MFNLLFWLGKEAPIEYTNKYIETIKATIEDNSITWYIDNQVIEWVLEKQVIIWVINQDLDWTIISSDLINNDICYG